MPNLLILAAYAAAAILTFFIIRHFRIRWDLQTADVIGLSILCPFFLLMCLDWGFGDLYARLTDGIFRTK